ncbi:hypothetical protein H5410_032329 [Solanum commersonii]|uniref:Uncharacterized protein n=1 Tax=Solanum commersonii TaxID=4109 RepID=A0A9J5YMK5_SOLCO|nr:hypothetical protein H5410_032329 [Solanum commersonii]
MSILYQNDQFDTHIILQKESAFKMHSKRKAVWIALDSFNHSNAIINDNVIFLDNDFHEAVFLIITAKSGTLQLLNLSQKKRR